MSVDWLLVKRALREVNNLPENDLGKQVYGVGESFHGRDKDTDEIHQCILDLFYSGYIDAMDVSHSGDEQIMCPKLNGLGLNLMEVLRDKELWNSVNEIVEESGCILDLESMRNIGLATIFD